MDSFVSLEHHKTKRREGEEGRVSRHVLKGRTRFNITETPGWKENKHGDIRKWDWSVHETLQGWGSTPYVSNIWAFCRKFRSDVSGVCPLGKIKRLH